MSIDNDAIVMRLEMIAAIAKQLAEDLKHRRLWDGQLTDGLRQISTQLALIQERP